MNQSFHTRRGSLLEDDDIRLATYFDTQLPWLASIGSASQWGDDPLSKDLKNQEKYREKLERSEAMSDSPWTPKSIRVYFADALLDPMEVSDEVRPLARKLHNGALHIPVAAMILEGSYADHDYAAGILPEQDEKDPFIFVASLVSDRRLYPISKGVGAVLLGHAQRDAKELEMKRVCLDCWRGNGRKLVRYYERYGFRVIGEVGDLNISQGEGNWPGAILELRL